MIVELFFKLIFGLISFLIGLLPTIDFNLELPDTTYFREILGAINWVFPVNTLIQALLIWFLLQNTQFILKIFNYVVKKIPLFG